MPQVTNVICAKKETEPISPRSEPSLKEKSFLPLKHRAGKMLKLLDLTKEKAQQISWTDTPRALGPPDTFLLLFPLNSNGRLVTQLSPRTPPEVLNSKVSLTSTEFITMGYTGREQILKMRKQVCQAAVHKHIYYILPQAYGL